MRTKTLLLTAALSVAGIATSLAQTPVYSVNAVGYVNTDLAPGFNLISNPLDNKTGNTIQNLFGTGLNPVPDGLTVYHWDPVTDNYVIAAYSDFLGGWDPEASAATVIAPGNGVFVFNPGTANARVTFVGEVPQGPLVNPMPQGFSIKASQVPQSGTVGTVLGYVPADGDVFFKWNTTSKSYDSWVFSDFLGGWDRNGQAEEPSLAVGEAAYVFKATAGTWNRTFTVNE
jgi:hypothetical protein